MNEHGRSCRAIAARLCPVYWVLRPHGVPSALCTNNANTLDNLPSSHVETGDSVALQCSTAGHDRHAIVVETRVSALVMFAEELKLDETTCCDCRRRLRLFQLSAYVSLPAWLRNTFVFARRRDARCSQARRSAGCRAPRRSDARHE